ncbi:ABC transporter permease [Corynebacterium ammoniagenes]|uniref:ABC transporter n=1 Tax=Corynebacterium ammoniagenes TaxID=1697 RepID=A0AAV5G2J0_CORAM|nr:ABC transporter permease [Corynebacterium ammoniagenes]GJN42939.1 ABC transporter [Corynebacterium ammoniagenes]
MTATVPPETDEHLAPPNNKKVSIDFSGVIGALPFFVFVAAFLIIPILTNVVRAFQDPMGNPSAASMSEAMGSGYRSAFLLTFGLSALTAVVGGIFGLVLAWALTTPAGPRWLNRLVNSFTALAAQSGGVQLAYGFVALLGAQGVMTKAVERFYPRFSEAFSLTDFWGVALVYLYFQIPLMTVLMLPALAGLKKEWLDAAASLGATRIQYIKDIAIPVLWPSMLGSFLLLFANAFAAYATAYALAGGSLNLVPIVIGFLISGNVMLNPSLAAAMVTWMMIIIIVAMGLRMILTRRSSKWLSN